ncbi:acyltransferase family protein [Aequorivita antarctica]|uniref:Acyltransferase n=1 Tax=Aequorivita antarctica TaxID=153266 RepID=A0A5C6Z3U1_9FLAO|nr:acyltransferase family protein [Aequorivita antarctica]TXD74262.1 acyltransferase [Aequorivita antarctica]
MNETGQKKIAINLDEYSKAIDGLRALAVIAVILNHFNNSILPSGFLGVDIFFVISGFVITASLVKRKDGDVSSYIKNFYKRRIKRLYPALIFCICITMILISFFSEFPNESILTGIFAIPGFSNIDLYYNAVDYWGKSAKLNPFTHTWSLGVEEQFYLIFPIVLWITVKRNKKFTNLKKLRGFLIFACITSAILYVYFSRTNQMLAYFMMPFRFWEIGMGCLLYVQLKINGYYIEKLLGKIPFHLIFISLIGVQFLSEKYIIFTTIMVTVLTVLIIAKIKFLEATSSESVFSILTNSISLYIGKISYSLYLWHWVVIVISYWTIGINKYTLPIQLVLIFMLASFSFYFVEKPLRHVNWRKSTYVKIIIFPFSLIIMLFMLQMKLSPNSNHLYLGTTSQKQSQRLIPNKLMQDYNTVSNCSKIRVIGNSHSLHIIPMLSQITNHFNLELIYENHPDYINIPMGDQKDIEKLDIVLSVLDKDDILILSSRNRYLYERPYLSGNGDKWIDHSQLKKERGYGLSIWLKELDKVISETKKKDIQVILFLPNVEFDKQIFNEEDICKNEWFRIPDERCNPNVSINYLNSRFPEAFYKEVNNRASVDTNFYVFNPMPIYCPDLTTCYRTINGVNAFKDTNHLTAEGANLMLDDFFSFLTSNHLL